MTFIKLTPASEDDGELYVDFERELAVKTYPMHPGFSRIARLEWPLAVRESPDEILSLLAEPQPVAVPVPVPVPVTPKMVEAALDVWTSRGNWRLGHDPDAKRQAMRAALEAALAVRAGA